MKKTKGRKSRDTVPLIYIMQYNVRVAGFCEGQSRN
jgi:hypothetical protein